MIDDETLMDCQKREMANRIRLGEYRKDLTKALERVSDLEVILRKCFWIINEARGDLEDLRAWSKSDTQTMKDVIKLLPDLEET